MKGDFIKTTYLAIVIALSSLPAFAQFTVAPHGSAGASAPPVGESRRSQCGAQGCLEVKIQPYCFGTNLRAYEQSKQLNPNEAVSVSMEFADASDGSKKDNFRLEFPAKLTFPSSADLRTPCSVMNPGASGPVRKIQCMIPEKGMVDYQITNWKLNQNPSCFAEYLSGEFCKYGTVQTDAQLVGNVAEVDQSLKCLYNFDKKKMVIENSVTCVLPSSSPNYSDLVKVYDSSNNEISSSLNVNAFTNSVSLVFTNKLASRSKPQVFKHGKPVTVKAPNHKISFSQGGREITAVIESAQFDEVNANNSFTAYVKFPGQEGFCGGFYSPLMLFFDNNLPKFSGISTFPLYGMKEGARVNWPEKGASGYFLVKLDKEQKEITSHEQLFGKTEKFENGFEALKEFDSNKDGIIDSKDPIFKSLALWRDADGNGLTEKGELVSLESKGIASISLKYNKRQPTHFDERAVAREKATFVFKDKKGKLTEGQIFDVWFSPID